MNPAPPLNDISNDKIVSRTKRPKSMGNMADLTDGPKPKKRVRKSIAFKEEAEVTLIMREETVAIEKSLSNLGAHFSPLKGRPSGNSVRRESFSTGSDEEMDYTEVNFLPNRDHQEEGMSITEVMSAPSHTQPAEDDMDVTELIRAPIQQSYDEEDMNVTEIIRTPIEHSVDDEKEDDMNVTEVIRAPIEVQYEEEDMNVTELVRPAMDQNDEEVNMNVTEQVRTSIQSHEEVEEEEDMNVTEQVRTPIKSGEDKNMNVTELIQAPHLPNDEEEEMNMTQNFPNTTLHTASQKTPATLSVTETFTQSSMPDSKPLSSTGIEEERMDVVVNEESQVSSPVPLRRSPRKHAKSLLSTPVSLKHASPKKLQPVRSPNKSPKKTPKKTPKKALEPIQNATPFSGITMPERLASPDQAASPSQAMNSTAKEQNNQMQLEDQENVSKLSASDLLQDINLAQLTTPTRRSTSDNPQATMSAPRPSSKSLEFEQPSTPLTVNKQKAKESVGTETTKDSLLAFYQAEAKKQIAKFEKVLEGCAKLKITTSDPSIVITDLRKCITETENTIQTSRSEIQSSQTLITKYHVPMLQDLLVYSPNNLEYKQLMDTSVSRALHLEQLISSLDKRLQDLEYDNLKDEVRKISHELTEVYTECGDIEMHCDESVARINGLIGTLMVYLSGEDSVMKASQVGDCVSGINTDLSALDGLDYTLRGKVQLYKGTLEKAKQLLQEAQQFSILMEQEYRYSALKDHDMFYNLSKELHAQHNRFRETTGWTVVKIDSGVMHVKQVIGDLEAEIDSSSERYDMRFKSGMKCHELFKLFELEVLKCKADSAVDKLTWVNLRYSALEVTESILRRHILCLGDWEMELGNETFTLVSRNHSTGRIKFEVKMTVSVTKCKLELQSWDAINLQVYSGSLSRNQVIEDIKDSINRRGLTGYIGYMNRIIGKIF
ncbi:hypothetical protein CANCADRAFT_31504 [Tortispora caseinolytica NRRL Y-17796]|uniref:Spc7 kinetochore protein domain-containing protein n=1 Tax=Tortispora caseinolytica NRRL Y-17796 TaxID=767744 RepID=A0A1E4TFQ8_9ASCO|nr:hypothetical protein CANCADRAFT_31504 [Tortispora caseinolytica NRRL Y-17796]